MKTSNSLELTCAEGFSNLKKRTLFELEEENDHLTETIFRDKFLTKKKMKALAPFNFYDIIDNKTLKTKSNHSGSLAFRRKLKLNKNDFSTEDSFKSDSETYAIKILTSNSFKRRIYSKRWTLEETNEFYKALGLFGTDFSMIALMLKNRNRSQIIKKFHKEEKQNPANIDNTIKNHNKGASVLLKKFTVLLNMRQSTIQKQRESSVTSLDSTDQNLFGKLKSVLIDCLSKSPETHNFHFFKNN